VDLTPPARNDVREFIAQKSTHVWQGFLLTANMQLMIASDATVMAPRTTVYDPLAAAAADQAAAAAAAIEESGGAAGDDESKGIVPSKDDLEMLILQLKGQNPDWGYKRMLTAVRCCPVVVSFVFAVVCIDCMWRCSWRVLLINVKFGLTAIAAGLLSQGGVSALRGSRSC
jgi:hypothetical protein